MSYVPERNEKGQFEKGVSGNPGGRPKNDRTWANIIREVGDMYPEDIAMLVGENHPLGQVMKALPQTIQMKYLITARVFAALMEEPRASLWNGLMDRAEGKVAERVNMNTRAEIFVSVIDEDEDVEE